jgi:4-hydroxy-3-methylbut-2-enyl diphosphate reductase
VLSVGLGGALTGDHPPGTVLVPDRVGGEDGQSWTTDRGWSDALRAASRRLGLHTAAGALVSTAEVVSGAGRAALAARGYDAVDMESAAVAAQVARLAVLRVVLDTPSHEISPRWRRPGLAALDPRLWPQGYWLARNAPRFAARAAAVLVEVLRGQALEGDVDPEI